MTKIHRMHVTCPYCGDRMDGHLDPCGSNEAPGDGDAGFCWTCKKFSIFTTGPLSGNPILRLPTDKELAGIVADSGWMRHSTTPLDQRETRHTKPAPWGTSNPDNIASVDIPAHLYPMTIEYIAVDGRVLDTEVIEGPGVQRVQSYGEPVGVRITYGDGDVTFTPPPIIEGQ